MEETFSVSLELKLAKFKSKMQDVKNFISQFGKSAKKGVDFEELLIGGSAKRTQIINKINDIKGSLQWAKEDANVFTKFDIIEMMAELETLEEQLKKTDKASAKLGGNLAKGLNDGLKKAKKFALSLFGIQSAYRMLSKASSMYLAQDEETSNKVKSAWIGLGSMFAPLLEKIANFTIKAVSYINVFIKALTGFDFLARAMDKSSKKMNKSAKSMQNSLAGFDEITNIGDSGSASDVDTSWVDAFKNQDLNLEWVDKIKNFGTWVKENWGLVIGAILGTVAAIKLVNLGLGGIKALGIGLVIAGVIMAIQGVIDLIKNPTWKNFSKVLAGIGLVLMGLGAIFGAWPLLVAGVIALVVSYIIKNWDFIKGIFATAFKYLEDLVLKIIEFFKEHFGIIGDILELSFKAGINAIKGVWKGTKQFFGGIKDFFAGLFTLDGKKVIGGLKSMLQGMGNVIFSFIEGVINCFFIPINSVIKLINRFLGVKVPILKVSIPRIPKLDVGTNYVPEDQIVMAHKGEAVIPKKFNDRKYFGNGNEETNRLLETLIDKVEQIEINPYTTIKDVGVASTSYINNQRRIMGRGVV